MTNERSSRVALRTALAYAVFAAIWIFASDTIVARLVTDPGTRHRVDLIKGWGFVAITSALLFVLVSRQLGRWNEEADRRRRSEEKLLRI